MKILTIDTGYFYADGGAMFGAIPKTSWSRRYPSNAQNGCVLAMRSLLIEADGRRLWRVLENLYNNAFKYALEGTRVYVTIEDHGADVMFTIKNVSANPLNISPDELTERFVRGDVSRTTEGSGLGLSIAKDLTTLQGGKFELIIDGDLFKAQITFPIKN